MVDYMTYKEWRYGHAKIGVEQNMIYDDETSMNNVEERKKKKRCQHDTWQPKVRSQTMS